MESNIDKMHGSLSNTYRYPHRYRTNIGSSFTARNRTSSSSSVEIQVTEAVTTTASIGAIPSNTQPLLFKPSVGFLEALKAINASGSKTTQGEVYTLKQLCFYLKKYIRDRQLYDDDDPRIVHCDKDPIGKALGVNSFSVEEAVSIVMQNTVPVDLQYPRSPPRAGTPPPQETSLQPLLHFDSALQPSKTSSQDTSLTATIKGTVPTLSVPLLSSNSISCSSSTNPSDQCTPSVKDTTPRHPAVQEVSDEEMACTQSHSLMAEWNQPSTSSWGQAPSQTENTALVDKRKIKKKRKLEKRNSECSPELNQPLRKRQSSLSIMYDGGGDDGDRATYHIDIKVTRDSDVESIYSVQSKETVIVQDSSDDYWFLTSEDNGGCEEEISVRMSNDGVSVEFNDMEEYELESLSSDDASYRTDLSDSTEEEICVTIQSEDLSEGFWADSESSEAEPESNDEELLEGDLWLCENCKAKNRPVRRFCEKCWQIRPGWLPSDLPHSAKSVPTTPLRQSPGHSPRSLRRNRRRPRPNSMASFTQSSPAQRMLQLGASPTENPSPVSRENSYISIPHLEEAVRRESSLRPDTEAVRSRLPRPSMNRQNTIILPAYPHSVTSIGNPSTAPFISAKTDNTPQLLVNDSGLGSSFGSSQGSTFSAPVMQFTQNDETHKLVSPPQPTVNCVGDASPVTRGSPSKGRPMALPCDPFLPSSSSPKKLRLFSPAKTAFPFPSADSLLPHGISPRKVNFPTSPRKRFASLSDFSEGCMLCMSRPKEASIIHGKSGHQVCCYQCAKKLKRRGRPCPVCRRPIQKVIRNFIA